MTPSPKCAALVRQFEGCVLKAYPDPGSGGEPYTIGVGATGHGIAKGVVWTQAQADARLASDIARFGRGVFALTGETTQSRFDAMVCLAFNIGVDNFGSSTLLRLHKTGKFTDVPAQFGRWNKAAGKTMAGLTRRRAAEAAMYQGAS